MGETKKTALRVDFDRSLKLEFHGSKITSDAGVVKFYNGRGTAKQWIKEGKNAVKWTRLSCHDFVDNQVRLSRRWRDSLWHTTWAISFADWRYRRA